MKKLLLTLLLLIIIPLKGYCGDITPQYVEMKYNHTLGVYQASNEIVLHKDPCSESHIIHSISWIGDKIFPETVKANELFVVLIPQKNLGLLAVTDETEEWVQVVYNNSTGDKGWIKKDDPYKFMSWIMFYNMYGKKYGLKMLKSIPPEAKELHTGTDDKSQIIGTINMPQKINLNVIKGNWALVSVLDIDRTPKTGYVRWRSDDGIKYYFPAIK